LNWYISAIISVIALTGQFLCMKKLQASFPITTYLAYIWLGGAITLGVLFVRPTPYLTLTNVGILAVGSVASWAGMYSYNLAIRYQSNLGYIEALSSTRVIITYCVSLLFFNAVPDVLKLFAVVGVVIGVIMVAGSRNRDRQKERNFWVLWAALSGVFFAIVITCTKVVLARGLDTYTTAAAILLGAGLIYISSAVLNHTSLKISGGILTVSLAIVLAAAGNVFAFTAFGKAPNLAYAVAISNSRIILLYLIAVLTHSDKLEFSRAIGVILAFVCVALFSFDFIS